MRELTYVEALNEALREEMQKDATMFIIGEDIGVNDGPFKVTKGLLKEFPGRIIDSPISENAITGAAYGAAICGVKAVAEFMFSDFAIYGLDNIVNSAAKFRGMHGAQANCPVVFRMPGGPGVQEGAQHSQSLEGMFAMFPGLKVVMPSTPADAKGLLKSAINDGNPVVFIEHKVLYNMRGDVPEGEYTLPIGKATIRRTGKDATVVANQVCMHKSLKAAEILAGEGIEIEVVDLQTIVPLDKETICESVKKTGRLVVSNEAPISFGISGEICTMAMENCFDFMHAPPARACGKDVVIPFNKKLEQMVIPQVEDICEAVRQTMKY